MKKSIKMIIILVLIVSIVVIIFVVSLKRPTTDEIKQLQLFYENYEQSLGVFPTDEDTLENMYIVSKFVFNEDIFFKAFDETSYYDKCQLLKDNSSYVIKSKKYFQNQLYDEAIFFHLKLLLSLDDYEEYEIFFVKYYRWFVDSIEVEFCDYLFEDDDFKLSKKDIEIIIQGYDKALNCCDNDVDRFVVLQDICDFLEKCENQEKLREMYLEQINNLLDENVREQFVKDYSKWRGFTSKKLTD